MTGLLLDAGHARAIEVTGADRLNHLDATTTQSLKDARPGVATSALVLDAHGNPLAMFDVYVLPDRVWLVTPSEDVAAVVMDRIAGRTFLADATFVPLTHRVVRAAVSPSQARSAWSGTAVVPDTGTVRSTPSGDTVIAAPSDGSFTLVGPADEVERLCDALRTAGAVDADAVTSAAWRVDAAVPAWGSEVVPPHLPEEAGVLPTHVHLAKGCYPGQEAVARMWMLGRPRRRLARVRLTGDATALAAVTPGWRTGDGRDAVEVTTVGPLTDGGRFALAFVPGASSVGTSITATRSTPSEPSEDDLAVEVLALVGDDPTPPGHDPAMRRRRDRTADAR